MKELKKSYFGFIVWMIWFVVLLFAIALVDGVNEKISILYTCNEMMIMMAILTWIIYKTEKIYWYTGISYEDAIKVESEIRKRYAYKHMIRFIKGAVVFVIYSVISYLCHLSYYIDIVIGIVLICGIAISTMNIHLEQEM